MQTNPPLTYFE
jgi:ribosome biogenesis GTPase A